MLTNSEPLLGCLLAIVADSFFFQEVLTLFLTHIRFLLFGDTCMSGSNGSTKFLERMLFLIPK
jgi:hypothetical protein